jgi:hypothetical protein
VGFYLGMGRDQELRLVIGYEAGDGTKIEIYEERPHACWHLTVLRPGERFPRECKCLSYKHAYTLFRNAIEVCEGDQAYS